MDDAFTIACAVCFSADGARRSAYLVSAAVLLSIPAVIMTALSLWIRRADQSSASPDEESGELKQASPR